MSIGLEGGMSWYGGESWLGRGARRSAGSYLQCGVQRSGLVPARLESFGEVYQRREALWTSKRALDKIRGVLSTVKGVDVFLELDYVPHACRRQQVRKPANPRRESWCS